MKKGGKKIKKIGFFAQHARCFLSVKFIIAAVVLAGLSAGTATYNVIQGKKAVAFDKQAANQRLEGSEEALSPPPVTSYPNLSESIAVYVFSRKIAPCGDYKNGLSQRRFSMRCKSASAEWRGHWVKKIDVSGYSKLRIKADLFLNDYTQFFAECGGVGVKYENYADLVLLSSDPTPTLDAECNHVVADAKWLTKCNVNFLHQNVMTHCGVSKCSSSQSCDFNNIDVSGQEAVYLLFSTNDVWPADIEGGLSNVEISLTK